MRKIAVLALGVALVGSPTPANAHDLTPSATRIYSLDAAKVGDAIEVNGTVEFGGQKLLTVATDPAGDAFPPVAEVDLVQARLGQLDPASGDLNFVFKLNDLPATGGVPEVFEYNWQGELPPLDAVFRIQTQFSNVLNTSPGPWAIVSICKDGPGACEPTSILGEYVGSDNEIFVDVPRALLESKLSRTVDGLSIAPGDGEYRDIETLLDPGPGPGPADVIASWSEYQIAYPRVDVSIAPEGTMPTQTVPAAVDEEGGFTASIDTAGLAPGGYDVVSRACFGTNCATYAVRVIL